MSQGRDTPLIYGKQLCEILFRSNYAVRSYGPATDFGYVCTVALTLDKNGAMGNNCVTYYLDRTSCFEVMARTRCEQMDRQTNAQGDSNIPPNFVCGEGYKKSPKCSITQRVLTTGRSVGVTSVAHLAWLKAQLKAPPIPGSGTSPCAVNHNYSNIICSLEFSVRMTADSGPLCVRHSD